MRGHRSSEGEGEACRGHRQMFVSQCGERPGAAGLHHQHRCKFDLFCMACAALCNQFQLAEDNCLKYFEVISRKVG